MKVLWLIGRQDVTSERWFN